MGYKDIRTKKESKKRGISQGPVHTKTIVNANASKRKLFYAFRPSVHHEDDENAHRKRINSKTHPKVDKFENAVYASSCGRPQTYVFVNAVKTLTSDVSASLFYRVVLKQRLQA